MPNNRFQGSRDDRLEHFERIGKRCDANTRTCVNKAIEEYDLQRTNGFGSVVDTEVVKRKCCGRHRAQFLANPLWHHLKTRRISADRSAWGQSAA